MILCRSSWEHVHPHLLDVYDFTRYARDSSFNLPTGNAFAAIAETGNVSFPFLSEPTFFGVDYTVWVNFRNAHTGSRLGRLGDALDFGTLPPNLQTAATAEAMGQQAEPSHQVVEVCGSVGEVANRPARGHRLIATMSTYGTYDWQGSEELVPNRVIVCHPHPNPRRPNARDVR